MAEDKFEQAVIDKLKSEGWEYLTDYSGVTVDRLYDHWRDILNANNRKRLEDTPLGAIMSNKVDTNTLILIHIALRLCPSFHHRLLTTAYLVDI